MASLSEEYSVVIGEFDDVPILLLLADRKMNDNRSYWESLLPMSWITLRSGYAADTFLRDAIAGLTVAILALPLSIAIAIGSGSKPEAGLITSVVAGFLISAFGGSRYQVGGPAAAFIVIVAAITEKFGTGGLLTATFLAGLILLIAGALKLGTLVRYVPNSVILGFTSGVGCLILVSQVKDFFGLAGKMPSEMIEKLEALWAAKGSARLAPALIGTVTLVLIIALRRMAPRWPGILVAVVAGSALVALLGLNVETVSAIPTRLPDPLLPDLSRATIVAVLPTAATLAFLVGVESLLSAVAADSITGTRHRSNAEIIGQGLANVASPLFGGMPATGVIARTGTNIQAGARTPVAGMLHAVFVLAFMLLLAPLVAYLAMPCMAAVLVSVAWRLVDVAGVRHYLTRAPLDDRIVMLATLLLTIFVDLNVAIAVGVVSASLLFMHRLAVAQLEHRPTFEGTLLPGGIRLVEIRGPFFYGVASDLVARERARVEWSRVLILDMTAVTHIDASGIEALDELGAECLRRGGRLIVAGLGRFERRALNRMGVVRERRILLARDREHALAVARRNVDAAPTATA
ncbi:MAG TPA: SulP family inorganic anion transporter [Hyphomicrobiaceae bacterium]|nr:SulP family inorganic anion transporter [Hyphomicrobiaceae bacterium]